MRDEHDFSKGKRGAVIPSKGKTRITIMLDADVIEALRTQAKSAGSGYPTLIDAALRDALASSQVKRNEPLTVAALRRGLREELQAS